MKILLQSSLLLAFALILLSCTDTKDCSTQATPKAPTSSIADSAPAKTKAATTSQPKSIFNKDLLEFEPAKLKAEGEIDPLVFKRVMGKRKSSFKVCYKKALDKDKKAKGQVKLRFNITPTGRVSNVSIVESNFPYQETTDCLVRVVRRIRFPAPAEANRVTVEYPLVFAP